MPKYAAIVGGRDLSPTYRPLVQKIGRELQAEGYLLLTGDARGADQYCRELGNCHRVFRPSEIVGNFSYVAKLMYRSFKMLDYAADSADADEDTENMGGLLVAFPTRSCSTQMPHPQRLYSKDSGARYIGYGSGTWASLAYAVQVGLRIFILPIGFRELPEWGQWLVVPKGQYTFYTLKPERIM